MAGKVRAKFYVQKITAFYDQTGNQSGHEVQLNPVYSSDPASENHAFWTASPSGELKMFITNRAAWPTFEQGGEFYLDFTHVEKEEISAEPKS